MGNREDLIAGARRCIRERGYAATTARDIAAAAGVSLAAIGYHFGSREQLLTEALTEAIGDRIGDRFDETIRSAGAERPLAEAFAATWDAAGPLFADNAEALVARLENLLRTFRTPQAQQVMADASDRAVAGIATSVGQTHPDLMPDQARAVAALYYTLLNGLALQWVMSPDTELPSGAQLAAAVRALAGS